MGPKTLPSGSKSGQSGPDSEILTRQALFGNPGRTDILVLVAGLGRSFPSELVRLTGLPKTTVLRALERFERTGVLVSTEIANAREIRLNPDYVAARELRALLDALLEREPRYRDLLAKASRRRPRRAGKPV